MRSIQARKGTSKKGALRKAFVLMGSAVIMGSSACAARTSVARGSEPTGVLLQDTLAESEIVLTVSDDGSRLRADVFAYDPEEYSSENTRRIMDEVVESCQGRSDMQQCINEEAVSRIRPYEDNRIPDAQVEFQYFSLFTMEWEEMDVLPSGKECDLSNVVPSLIRVIYAPGPGSGIRGSDAEYQMPLGESLDSD